VASAIGYARTSVIQPGRREGVDKQMARQLAGLGRSHTVFSKLMTAVILLATCLASCQIHRDTQLPSKKINGIVFLDANHGFVQMLTLSHPETYETLDGGKTWNHTQQRVPGFRTGRAFATRLKGWSIDEKSEDTLEKETYNKVLSTQDGGATWLLSLKTDRKGDFVFGGIQAISETEVWVVGTSGAYHSVNGGKTWERSGPAGTGLQFLDAQRGWLQDDKFWHTGDGGRAWEGVPNEGKACFGGFSFFFLDNLHGWAVSGNTEGKTDDGARVGHVIATNDGGKTCIEIVRLPGEIPWSVFFLNEREGWVGGIGSLRKTEDGGRTWLIR
jgi:photosystem II stability/assembly factor-like uncharacterized protein